MPYSRSACESWGGGGGGARGGAPLILCGDGVSHGGSSTAAPQKIVCGLNRGRDRQKGIQFRIDAQGDLTLLTVCGAGSAVYTVQ